MSPLPVQDASTSWVSEVGSAPSKVKPDSDLGAGSFGGGRRGTRRQPSEVAAWAAGADPSTGVLMLCPRAPFPLVGVSPG